jgi:cbb3-type cytochrome oxidase maturation protein
MSALYLFLAIALVIFAAGLIALVWSIRSGQYDDLDTPALRILGDDLPVPDATQDLGNRKR